MIGTQNNIGFLRNHRHISMHISLMWNTYMLYIHPHIIVDTFIRDKKEEINIHEKILCGIRKLE